jgi:hypothetical protein
MRAYDDLSGGNAAVRVVSWQQLNFELLYPIPLDELEISAL